MLGVRYAKLDLFCEQAPQKTWKKKGVKNDHHFAWMKFSYPEHKNVLAFDHHITTKPHSWSKFHAVIAFHDITVTR